MSFYIRKIENFVSSQNIFMSSQNNLCHFILEIVKFYVIANNMSYKYMDWFKKISVKEYEDLIKNKNKMYNISKNFTTPELMNKYRDEDEIINKKLKLMKSN